MNLLQTILSSFQDPRECIDFTVYELSKLSPAERPKLAMAYYDVRKFLADAPEVITRNLAYWYQHNLQPDEVIQLRILQAIDELAKATDTELSMIFLSLLIHASKYKINIFTLFVGNIHSGAYRRASAQETPSQQVINGALHILKSDPFLKVSTDILNAHIGTESQITTAFTRQQIEQCNIHFVFMGNSMIKGWATADGVAINVAGLLFSVETLEHRVALASLLGHVIQHYLSMYAFDNMNVSMPEKALSNSPSEQKLKLEFPDNLESGLCFEYAAFGAKFDFKVGLSRPLLNVLEQRLSNIPVCLPLIREDEKDEAFVKPFLCPNLNAPFGFELTGEDELPFE